MQIQFGQRSKIPICVTAVDAANVFNFGIIARPNDGNRELCSRNLELCFKARVQDHHLHKTATCAAIIFIVCATVQHSLPIWQRPKYSHTPDTSTHTHVVNTHTHAHAAVCYKTQFILAASSFRSVCVCSVRLCELYICGLTSSFAIMLRPHRHIHACTTNVPHPPTLPAKQTHVRKRTQHAYAHLTVGGYIEHEKDNAPTGSAYTCAHCTNWGAPRILYRNEYFGRLTHDNHKNR